MNRFTVEFAGIRIGITAKYEVMKDISSRYIIDTGVTDFNVEISDEELARETADFTPGELEALAIYRKIAAKLWEYDAFLLHGVALDIRGEGIIFTAKSGTGKSTHAMLWKKLFGDECIFVNGDKPIIRFSDGIPYAYGTPYAGKEGYHVNMKTPVKNLAFINRSEENHVQKADKSAMLTRLMPSAHIPSGIARLKTFELLGKFISSVDFWDIYCNMDPEAAEISSGMILGGSDA